MAGLGAGRVEEKRGVEGVQPWPLKGGVGLDVNGMGYNCRRAHGTAAPSTALPLDAAYGLLEVLVLRSNDCSPFVRREALAHLARVVVCPSHHGLG